MSEPALTGRRILIVDDNADAAQSLATLLQMTGNEVSVAANGSDALRIATESRPELVLLDIGLPGMNGYEVARALRRDPGNGSMLIVGVSGYGAAEDRQRGAEAGLDAHFVKPVEISALAEFVSSRPAGAAPHGAGPGPSQ
jgi:CheY-like chemotaxis protein